jgi:ATP-dependent protease ClpP protease subunit
MNKHQRYPDAYRPVAFVTADGDQAAEPQPGESAGGVSVDQQAREAHLFIWGDIGGWFGAHGHDVYDALVGRDLDTIHVWLASAGGSVLQGFQIYDLLKGHPAQVSVTVFSLAASAATFPLLAASPGMRKISRQSMVMIHKGSNMCFGYYTAEELDQQAAMVRKFDNRIIELYDRETNLNAAELPELMQADVWLEPEEALAAGFVDEIVDFAAVPFDLAGMTRAQFDEFFYDHSAAHARKSAQHAGFSAIAASALNPYVQNAPHSGAVYSTNKKDPKMKNSFAQKLANLITGNGWKVTDESGQEVNAAAIDTLFSDGDGVDLLGDAMRTQISDLVASGVAGSIKDLEKDTADLVAELSNKVKDLATQLEAVQAGVSESEQTDGAVQQTATELQKLKNEIAKMKTGQAAGQRSQDSGGREIGGDDTGTSPSAFSQKSKLYRTMTANGLVTAAEIEAIEKKVRQQRSQA